MPAENQLPKDTQFFHTDEIETAAEVLLNTDKDVILSESLVCSLSPDTAPDEVRILRIARLTRDNEPSEEPYFYTIQNREQLEKQLFFATMGTF